MDVFQSLLSPKAHQLGSYWNHTKHSYGSWTLTPMMRSTPRLEEPRMPPPSRPTLLLSLTSSSVKTSMAFSLPLSAWRRQCKPTHRWEFLDVNMLPSDDEITSQQQQQDGISPAGRSSLGPLPGSTKLNAIWSSKPEITHQHRKAEKRVFPLIPIIFTLIAVTPMLVFLLLLKNLGIKHQRLSLFFYWFLLGFLIPWRYCFSASIIEWSRLWRCGLIMCCRLAAFHSIKGVGRARYLHNLGFWTLNCRLCRARRRG